MTAILRKRKRSRELRLESHPENEQLGKALERAGQYCFSQLTLRVRELTKKQRRELGKEFRLQFEAVIREHEKQRFEGGEYGPLIIRTSSPEERMPNYIRLTLERMDDVVKMSWPRGTVVWIDLGPHGIKVERLDKEKPAPRVLYPKFLIY